MKKDFFIHLSLFVLILIGARAMHVAAASDADRQARLLIDGSAVDFGAVVVSDYAVTGTANGISTGTIAMNAHDGNGVFNDGFGNLSGYASGTKSGWVNFAPLGGGVTIDANGVFHGRAWSQNLGWIAFDCVAADACATSNFKVTTAWRPKYAPVNATLRFGQVSYTGILNMFHTDDFAGKEVDRYYQLLTADGKTINLTFSDQRNKPAEERNGEQLTITGTLDKDRSVAVTNMSFSMPASGSAVRSAQEEQIQSTHSASVIIPHIDTVREYKVATILFNFSNNTSETYSTSDARRYIYDNTPNDPLSVNGYYHEATYGKIDLTGVNNLNGINGSGDVYGWYALPHDDSNCSIGTAELWAHEAATIAAQHGFNPSSYDSVVFIFPAASGGCGNWGGFAHIINVGPANQPILKYSVVNVGGYQGNIVHELGHTLGLSHSNALQCHDNAGIPVAFGQSEDGITCNGIEYGDPFDIMAGAWRHFSNVQKNNLGVLPQNAITDIVHQFAGVYDLYPEETLGSGARMIRLGFIPDPVPMSDNAGSFDSTGTFVHSPSITPTVQFDGPSLEYREPYGVWDTFQPADPVVNGVTIRYGTSIIDTTPYTSNFDDAPLRIGRSFTDPITGRMITVASVTPAKATVAISSLPPSPPPPPPSCIIGFPVAYVYGNTISNPIDIYGQVPITVTTIVANTDDSLCAPSLFKFPTQAIWDGAGTTDILSYATLNPGQTMTFTTAISAIPTLHAGFNSVSLYPKNVASGYPATAVVYINYHPPFIGTGNQATQ